MQDEAALSAETRGAIHEKRVCDIAARITLAILGGALPKSFTETLQKYKGKVGPSYDKIILELGSIAEKEKPKKKPDQIAAVAVTDPVEDPIEEAAVDDDAMMEAGSEMES